MKIGTDGVLLGAWSNISEATRVLDIGSGTGLIALMIAQRNENTQIDAVEIDKASALEAQHNIRQSPWSNRVSIINDRIQHFSETNSYQYDHIVSNPPFFNSGTPSPAKNRNQARHAHELSQKDLVRVVSKLLLPEGKFSIILPVTESDSFVNIAYDNNLYVNRKTVFFPKRTKPAERHLIEFSYLAIPLEEGSLIQYNEDGEWTSAYKNLTQDFHIKL